MTQRSVDDIAFPPATLAQMRTNFARDGFIRIEGLTTAADIAAIRSLLDPLFTKRDPATTLPLHQEIAGAVSSAPALLETRAYARCRDVARFLLGAPVGCIFDHAIYKPAHHSAAVAWHQDEIYNMSPMPQRAVNFWLPLEPTTDASGCLWQATGSHRAGLRPHHAVGEGPNYALNSLDEASAIACQTALGDATAHHPLSAHATRANRTDSAHWAWVLHFGAYGKYRYKLHPRAILAKLGLVPKRVR